MQNYLKYYYDLDVDNIYQKSSNYYFKINDLCYIFFVYNEDLNNLINTYIFSNKLFKSGFYTNSIIMNKLGNLYTQINGTNYVLIRYYDNLNRIINMNDILYFDKIVLDDNNYGNNWKRLWEDKIDYFEYQLSQFGLKYPIARDSFWYFAGYVETGIMLMNEIDIASIEKNKLYKVLSHKRIFDNENLYNLYDPFNMIIDFRPRDIAEYFKNQFLHKKNIINEIISFLDNSGYNNIEFQLFFIRMLYPSFYFDAFEQVMNGDADDASLKSIISLKDIYEDMIVKLYNYFSKKIQMPRVEWFIRY